MKNNLVRKNDYELYLMNIPFTLLGKKRKQFIRRELEKVHPCFGEQYSFDSKRCIRKGKIQTLIAVMDKVKILEYKKNKRSGLFLEGVKAGEMFSENHKIPALLFLTVLVFSCMFFSAALGKKNQVHEFSNKINGADYDFITEAEPILHQYPDSKEILEECLENIKLNNGKINSLSAVIEQIDGKSYLAMSLSLENMFPENLLSHIQAQETGEVNISRVNYSKDMPAFDYSIHAQINEEEIDVLSGERVSNLRNLLGTCCLIKEEDFIKAGFNCELSEKKFSELFEKINSIEDFALKEVSVSKAKDVYNVSLAFMSGHNQIDRGIAKVLLDYSSLFVGSEKEVESKPQKSNSRKSTVVDAGTKKDWEQIGRVIQKNGRVIVYYRDEKNQIRGVEE